MHPLRGPRALDELLAFQPIKRAANYRAFIADKACDLVGAGETQPAAAHEYQYVPLTEQGDTQALYAAVD